MFRFWSSESRGSEETVDDNRQETASSLPDAAAGQAAIKPQHPKRRRTGSDASSDFFTGAARVKRVKPVCREDDLKATGTAISDRDRVRDVIRHHFGIEILLKHNELRLINQELGKCQVALEQLRRCHLIPYPVNCPTPSNMLDISAGKGPAARSQKDEKVPRWAPPFGVVDGPYARHYAKWLIPDPLFDGKEPEWQFTAEAARARMLYAEGRTTRNSYTESNVSTFKGRGVRGRQGLHALPMPGPPIKDKAGPCVLKRSDGQTVKLVCVDCHRENFSSTQGFINHCRIAHKRDYKSHEEAAVHCGKPIDTVSDASGSANKEDKAAGASSGSPVAHPLAQSDISETYRALRARLDECLKSYNFAQMPVAKQASTGSETKPESSLTGGGGCKFEPSADTPHLSRLMRSRSFDGSLKELVADAKTKVSFEDITPGEESEDTESSAPISHSVQDATARVPVVMRVPARSTMAAEPSGQAARPLSQKGQTQQPPIVSPPDSTSEGLLKSSSNGILSDDEDMDVGVANLSPHTLISNNAPSLVSDDGEYDESDEGSSISGASDNLDAESVSDVAEITIDDEHDPRPLRRTSATTSNAMRLRKDESKQVTFVSPVKRAARGRPARKG